MKTIVIDLFHPYPDESLDKDGIEHDIHATSEIGCELAHHFKQMHRFFYCDDLEHANRVEDWHSTSPHAAKHALGILDIQSINQKHFKPSEESLRIIINAQGFLSNDDKVQDQIGGYDPEYFKDVLTSILDTLCIDKTHSNLAEVVISACSMAHSNPFTSLLDELFEKAPFPVKVTFFKEMICFSQGHYLSFHKDGRISTHTIDQLTKDVALFKHYPTPQPADEAKSIYFNKMPLLTLHKSNRASSSDSKENNAYISQNDLYGSPSQSGSIGVSLLRSKNNSFRK